MSHSGFIVTFFKVQMYLKENLKKFEKKSRKYCYDALTKVTVHSSYTFNLLVCVFSDIEPMIIAFLFREKSIQIFDNF